MPDEDFFEDEELVATAPSQRNWLGIILALLVIAFIFSMIVLSAALLMPREKRLPVTGRRFTLDDIVGNDFRVPPFNGSWLSGEELVYRDMSGGLTVLNCKTMKARLLMSNVTFRQWDVHHYSVSPDQNYVLLEHDFRPVYRHSSLARYTVFDVIRGNPLALTATPDDRGHPVLSWAQWVPTDSADPGRGNALIMLYRGDVYFKQSALSDIVDRVTDTGLPGIITNGQPDWLYEEEILESSTALWFSRDGSKLVYASFNDSAVEAVPLVNYQISPQSTHLDPGVTWVRYPKAGSVNPTVTLWVVNLYSLKSPPRRDLKPPSELLNRDYYFTGVTWVDGEMVAVTWMNRLQNTSYITECPISLGYCSETHVEEQREGWLEVQPAPVYSRRGGSYLTLLPVRDAAVGTFRHISRYDVNPSRMTPLTIGPLQVTRILVWDERLQHIYFQAVRDAVPGDRHLYRINSSGAIYKAKPECITCRANTSRHHCTYTTATLSPELGFYVLECLGPGVPWIRLFSLPSNEFRANLTDHPELRHLAAQMAFPRIEFRSVRLNDNTNASVKLLLPPGLSIYDVTTYPIMLHVYGGPGTQQVTSRWRVDWGTYMASGQDFVYAWIDGSGSGNHGDALKHRVYGRLGSLEVQDQLRVLEELVEQEYFLDRRRVMIWGWSYGGYAAAMALAQDDRQLLRGAISVAPVTDWQLYDSAYTERYMGMPGPQGNYRGYEEADLTSRAGQLAGRKLLLVHGAADDNVHVQHSMVLSRALVQSGVNFQQQIFADENHSLSGVKRYLYQKMEDFINQCFLPTSEVIDKALAKYFKKRKQTQ